MSAHSPALLAALKSTEAHDPAANLRESDHYLVHTEHGLQIGNTELANGTEASVYRLGTPTNVWLSLDKGTFSAATVLTAAEARRIAEALLKAAEDAEEAQRNINWRDEYEIQRENDRLIEDELCREAEERGEEYVPSAIGAEHMYFIELAVLHGHPLKLWQEELKPSASYLQYQDGGCIELDCSPLGMFNTWSRWAGHTPLRHLFTVRHAHTDTTAAYPAVVDDFGTLAIVPEECHA